MDKGIISLIVLILILCSIFGFMYYKYESKRVDIEFTNVSVSAEFNNKKIITGIKIGENLYNTSEEYELLKLQKNSTITIENVNLENQYFYKDSKTINLTEDNMRIDLKLEEVKPIDVSFDKEFPINVNMYSEDWRDLEFCLTSSLNYIFLNSNFTEIQNLQGYENWDVCYDTQTSINGEFSIQVEYKEFGEIKENDYINISIITPEFLGVKDKIVKIK